MWVARGWVGRTVEYTCCGITNIPLCCDLHRLRRHKHVVWLDPSVFLVRGIACAATAWVSQRNWFLDQCTTHSTHTQLLIWRFTVWLSHTLWGPSLPARLQDAEALPLVSTNGIDGATMSLSPKGSSFLAFEMLPGNEDSEGLINGQSSTAQPKQSHGHGHGEKCGVAHATCWCILAVVCVL